MRSVNLKSIGIIVILFLAGNNMSFAQGHSHGKSGDHEHKAPHGGIVKSAGKYHIEMVNGGYICPMKCKGGESAKAGKCPVCGMNLTGDGKVKVYLLDAKERTMNVSKASGKVMLQLKDGKMSTLKLKPSGDEYLWAQISEGQMKFQNAIVTIDNGEANVTAKFSGSVEQHKHEHDPDDEHHH